ncbi:MAG: hypothetical protein ACOY4R_26370 [Pseudomonadota bacterium]
MPLVDYVLAHWRGQLSLGRSFWINGIAGYLVVLALVLGMASVLPVVAGIAIFGLFFVWSTAGIARSGLAVVRSSAAPMRQKTHAYAALALVAIAAVALVGDLVVLLAAAGR